MSADSPSDRTACTHSSRDNGVCTQCGHCLHEIVLNGACYFCGTTDIDPRALSPRPDLVPAHDLVRKPRDPDAT